jgi:hypothetical protein
MWWILYCAMQAVPAIDPTPHTAFDSQEKCFKHAEVSNSFGELHCVCADEPLDDQPWEEILKQSHVAQ